MDKTPSFVVPYFPLKCSKLFSNKSYVLESSWNVMAHGDARKGKRRGNWWMEWVASTLHTTSEHGVSNITTANAHTSAVVDWTDPPSPDLNKLVRFAERRNLVSARVPSHFKCSLQCFKIPTTHSTCINTVTHNANFIDLFSAISFGSVSLYRAFYTLWYNKIYILYKNEISSFAVKIHYTWIKQFNCM
jgi:hypothetical protein